MEYKDAEHAVVEVFGAVEQRVRSSESSGEDSSELGSAMSSGVLVDKIDGVTLVDAHGNALFNDVSRIPRRPEVVWGAQTTQVVEKRLAEARQSVEWALQ